MKTNTVVLFKNVLHCANDLKAEMGGTLKVYPARSVYLLHRFASFYSELSYGKFYNVRIGPLQKQNLEKGLDRTVKTIRRVDRYRIDPKQSIYEQGYLDATSVTIKNLIANQGPNAACFPQKDFVFLLPFYWEYQFYKFLEKYKSQVGEKAFLENLVRLEHYIKLAKVNDTFYWDKHDMTPLYELHRKMLVERGITEQDYF